MRLSDMTGKEVINLHDGTRMGVFGEADLLLEVETGRIRQLYLPEGGLRRNRSGRAVNWADIVRVGPDLVVVNAEAEPRANQAPAAAAKR